MLGLRPAYRNCMLPVGRLSFVLLRSLQPVTVLRSTCSCALVQGCLTDCLCACRGELTAGSCLPEALQGHLHTHAAATLAACRVRSPALLMDHRRLPLALDLGPQLAAHTVEPGASSRGPGHLVRLLPLHLTSPLALQ